MKISNSFILFISLLFFIKGLSGQAFQRTYGSKIDDSGNEIAFTQDGHFVIVGFHGQSKGVNFLKLDSIGNYVWKKSYRSPGMHRSQSFKETSDGGFIITSSIYDQIGESDIGLIKTDKNGDMLWKRMFSGSFAGPNRAEAHEIISTSDNGYAIVGTLNNYVFLIKTDSIGNLEWSKYYGGTNKDEGYSVKQTSNESFIIAGYTESFGQGNKDVYLLKTDSYGELLWSKTYGGDRIEFASHIEITSDGGYILTGVTSGFGTGSIYTHDMFLMKTDSEGNVNWAYTYGGDENDAGLSVKQTSDGGYIATGYSSSFGPGQESVYLVKTDSHGSLLWSRTYGGSSTEYGSDVIELQNGYAITGTTRNFSQGLRDIYLIRVNEFGLGTCKQDTAYTQVTHLPWVKSTGGEGFAGGSITSHPITIEHPDTLSYDPCICIPPVSEFFWDATNGSISFFDYSTWADIWHWDFDDGETSNLQNPYHFFYENRPFNVCLTVTNDCGSDTFCNIIYGGVGVNEPEKNATLMIVFPNPSAGVINLKFENRESKALRLVIFDQTGKEIKQTGEITGDFYQINSSNLAGGLYYIQLIRQNQIIAIERIIIK